jgi:hypothetical protein
MKSLPQDVSESVRRRNPHLYDKQTGIIPPEACERVYKPRIRQSTKPLLNKLEQEWFNVLCGDIHANKGKRIYPQAITFKLANGLKYTPDCIAFDWVMTGEFERPTAWEVKGPWATDDAIAKVKMFTTAYPEIRVILVWKDDNKQWCQQRVLA